jgi:dTDP-glucose 4,6-dehydratase
VLVRALVTGSLGTLGRPLTKELRERGHDVFGCDLRHCEQEETHYLRGDVGDYRQLQRVFETFEPEAVYHLAAEFGRHNGERNYEDVFHTNYLGTRNILEMCAEFDARLIFASSSEIYGTCEEDWLYEDLSKERPLRQPNEYALSKWANEVQIQNFSARHGLDAVRLRFFNAYGPGEYYHPYRSVIALFCHRALNGIPWTVYEGYHRTFMYIDDFTPTLANVLERGKSGQVYNIGGEDYRSVREASDLILAETGADPELVAYLPEDVHNVKSKRPENSRARRDLDHYPMVTIEEGVPKTLEWMESLKCQSVTR